MGFGIDPPEGPAPLEHTLWVLRKGSGTVRATICTLLHGVELRVCVKNPQRDDLWWGWVFKAADDRQLLALTQDTMTFWAQGRLRPR